jgi:salicylate hydroxylase/6-hydroxynicotinate 3-monooxygenase
MRSPRIAIVGAGIGGLAAAAALQKAGLQAKIYEQAPHFARVGAGIQMSPNAVKVIRAFDLEDRLRSVAFQPGSWKNRDFDTGAMRFEYPLGATAEGRYGAPYLLMHRGDLHAALASVTSPEVIELGRRLTKVEDRQDEVILRFADGSEVRADLAIGADGVHSVMREHLLGPEKPRFSGRVAYRTVFPAALLEAYELDDNTKWWGPDRHIVIYFVNPQRGELYFVTSVPEPDWTIESWSAEGNIEVLRAAFADFHPQVQHVLRACPKVHKWAILERDPLPRWSGKHIVLLGDACHPMTPYMAQGAAMAMEDAVVLARCLEGANTATLQERCVRYEALRRDRASRVQLGSHQNQFMSGQTDPDWVYGYDAWTSPLAPVHEAA